MVYDLAHLTKSTIRKLTRVNNPPNTKRSDIAELRSLSFSILFSSIGSILEIGMFAMLFAFSPMKIPSIIARMDTGITIALGFILSSISVISFIQ